MIFIKSTTGLAWLVDSPLHMGDKGIGKDVPRAQRTPMGNPYISPIYWVFMGYSPQESQG